jgi:hypothetical protein
MKGAMAEPDAEQRERCSISKRCAAAGASAYAKRSAATICLGRSLECSCSGRASPPDARISSSAPLGTD